MLSSTHYVGTRKTRPLDEKFVRLVNVKNNTRTKRVCIVLKIRAWIFFQRHRVSLMNDDILFCATIQFQTAICNYRTGKYENRKQ
jgi:hypothetical protein